MVLEQIASTIYAEEEWISHFLQIDDAAKTYADHMNLENYFRRQASRWAGLSQATTKLVRGAMDLIFGFLPMELKAWLDTAMARDNVYVAMPCQIRPLLIFSGFQPGCWYARVTGEVPI